MPAYFKAQLLRHLFLVVMPLSGILLRHLLRLEAFPEVTFHFITDNFFKCDSEIEDRKVSCDVVSRVHETEFEVPNFSEKLLHIQVYTAGYLYR